MGRISGLPSGRPSLMPTPALPFWLDDEQFAQGLGLHLCRGAVLRTVFTLSSVVTVSLTSGMTSGVWVSSSLRPELCSASAGHFSENLLAYLPPALSSTLLPPSSPASPLRKQTGRRDSGCHPSELTSCSTHSAKASQTSHASTIAQDSLYHSLALAAL